MEPSISASHLRRVGGRHDSRRRGRPLRARRRRTSERRCRSCRWNRLPDLGVQPADRLVAVLGPDRLDDAQRPLADHLVGLLRAFLVLDVQAVGPPPHGDVPGGTRLDRPNGRSSRSTGQPGSKKKSSVVTGAVLPPVRWAAMHRRGVPAPPAARTGPGGRRLQRRGRLRLPGLGGQRHPRLRAGAGRDGGVALAGARGGTPTAPPWPRSGACAGRRWPPTSWPDPTTWPTAPTAASTARPS